MLIATFTDFGVRGPYLGQVRAVLHQQAPGVPVVDLFPDLPVFDVRASAYLVPAYSQYLPPDSVCLCVVDPGVGGARAAIAVQADGRWYVGPDNGLLSLVVRRASVAAAFTIGWRPEQLSASFHGRDLFAPVCAALAQGQVPGGSPVETGRLCSPDWPDDLHEIVYIDHYGNAITGLRAGMLSDSDGVEIAGVLCEYRRTFSEADDGAPFWYANSNGLVEIATNADSARRALTLSIGQAFQVIRR